jgi:RNA-directed DNA polymerase
MRRDPGNQSYERYELGRSPLAQQPTQRQLAELLGMSRNDLRRHADFKSTCIVRRKEVLNGKLRNLAYPVGPLRVIHEKLKYHLNKVKQPDYLFSPRKGRGQRENAHYHIGSRQFLTLDLKQFYPSTTFSMVKSWLCKNMGMYEDVAGLFTTLATVDGVVSFGSPLTPVLVSLVHREMFDEIARACDDRGLIYSVWVDNLTISGEFVEGELVEVIRTVIAKNGLKSHEIAYRCGNRPVFITGIGVVGGNLVAPQSFHLRIKALWDKFHDSETDDERESLTQQLLAQMGSVRYIAGAKSKMGQSISDRMNSIRQKRDKWRRVAAGSLARKPRIVKATINAEMALPAPWA